MCDCFEAKCKECEVYNDIHIGDYVVERDEIEVYCKDHIPDINVEIFELSQIVGKWVVKLKRVNVIGIRYLTDEAKENRLLIHPNTLFEMDRYVI